MNDNGPDIKKALPRASALLAVVGALLLGASLYLQAPWWAVWVPLFLVFVTVLVAFFLALIVSLAPPAKSAQRGNVVDLSSRRDGK